MNKESYLAELERYLRRLPKEDHDSAMDYFTEYFDEAGTEQALAQLGSPRQEAEQLLQNLLQKQVQTPKEHKTGNIILLTLLAICAAPIAAPIAIAGVALVLAFLLVIACVLLCVVLFAVAALLVGGKLLLRAFFALPFSIPGALVIAGIGLLFLGISILLVLGCIWLFRLCTVGIGKWTHSMMQRKKVH